MNKIHVSSITDLESIISELNENSLFRGQCKNYPSADAPPSIIPSFFANGGAEGCIPRSRHRWSTYASFIIYTILGHDDFDSHLCEAILQHYGWKSFFLDLSYFPHVATWFSSHSYSESPCGHFSEDCWELPVFLKQTIAKYEPYEGIGHLFVISKEGLESHGFKVLDLEQIKPEMGVARASKQAALLAGPFDGNALPLDCITHHITGPSELFREYSKKQGLVEVESIFPPAEKDPIYNNLLSLPWNKINTEGPLDFYQRFLEIPDYFNNYRKHLPASIAFYSSFNAHDIYIESGKPFINPAFFLIEDYLYFSAGYPENQAFPQTLGFLEDYDMLIFEIDTIVSRPDFEDNKDYSKGLVITKVDEDTIDISELIVSHLGTQIQGIGTEKGWHYKIQESGALVRHQHKEDCPCGNKKRHEFHMQALKRIESSLQEKPQQISERLFKCK